MSKVPSIHAPKIDRPRNAFDLSQKHLFSAAPGILYPVLSLDCIKDDKLDVSLAQLVKSMPIVNNPFINCKGILEFFFVPYHQVWHPFDQFQTQMMDFHSRLYDYTEPLSSVPQTSVSNFKHALTIDQPTPPDMFGYYDSFGLAVYSDLLGYGLYTDGTLKKGTNHKLPNILPDKYFPSTDYNMNQFRIASFNKIYMDYYRKTNYEPYNAATYSLDNNAASDYNENILVQSGVTGYKYRNYSLDLITNAVPSPNLQNNSFATANNIIPNTYIQGDNKLTWKPTDAGVSNPSSIDSYAVSNSSTNPAAQSISVSSLKAAFALQKLGSLIGRTDKNWKSQMDALFGGDMAAGRDDKAIYAGGFDFDINFDDIPNTNGDTYGKQYSTYGNVTSNGNGHISFRCPEHGVFMAIFSIVPIIPYDSNAIDVNNTHLNYQDFYNPIFENIGLQPISALSLNQAEPNKFLSWQPRYSEYKSALDRNHMCFNSNLSLSSFTSARRRSTSTAFDEYNLNMFKVNPNCLDSVFAVNFDGSSSTAPFMCDFNFNVVKLSNMQLHNSSLF